MEVCTRRCTHFDKTLENHNLLSFIREGHSPVLQSLAIHPPLGLYPLPFIQTSEQEKYGKLLGGNNLL